MNERIKDIREAAEAARQLADDEVTHSERVHNRRYLIGEWSAIFEEKFAELIVKECISKLDGIGVIDRDSRTIAMKVISEHFGVKE